MIHDLATESVDRLPAYDVCIVGSGPAGGTIAAGLAGSGLRVAVLESGRMRPTAYGDALREVRSEGLSIKITSRERVLGGASTTWAGLSSPLDPIDLIARPWMRRSGWPISRDELLPYWEQAAARHRFASLERYEDEVFGALKSKCERSFDWSELEEKIFLAASEPQDFGRELRHVYQGAGATADLWLDATVVRLEASGGGEAGVAETTGDRLRVTRAVVRTSTGREVTLSAGTFVLAAGGIENARLLLVSRDRRPACLGNENDQVGRHLMNHPKNYHGTIRLRTPLREMPYYFGCLHQGFAGYAGLRLREDLQEARGLLNSYVRFEPLFPWSDSPGVEALVMLVKRSRGALRRWKAGRSDEVVSLRDWSETGDDTTLGDARPSSFGPARLLGLVASHTPSVARYVVARLRDGRSPPVTRVRIRNFMEMEPSPDNRVTLGSETDPHGLPVPVVRMRPSDLDRRSMAAVHDVLAREVERVGLGTLEGRLRGDEEPWPIDQDASHHLGTTRMGRDPATSVVDPTCRLHGVDNVYVAGGSVFPTSGCANPTFTIVALSIRLAEHLRSRALRGAWRNPTGREGSG